MSPQFTPLSGGSGVALMGALGAPDLSAAGYVEHELAVTGTARAWRCVEAGFPDVAPFDGRLDLIPGPAAPFSTRVVLRRPTDADACSGTVVLEWLNVSSGADAAPGWGFVAQEVVRRGHVWIGCSAQLAGIESAPALVDVGGVALQGLRQADPERYGGLRHPGDAWSYDIFTCVARAVRAGDVDALADLAVRQVVAIGESQSAYALTTYLDGVQPIDRALDAALVHSRGGPAAPLDSPDGRFDLDAHRRAAPIRIRDDLAIPVLVLQTETDVLGHLGYLPARQDDTDRFRLWEVAGTAHADRSLVGDFESVLGCDEPVNRGQQRFVARAALRALVEWGSRPPASAPRLDVRVHGDRPEYATDGLGNVTGGVRTPCVDAPVEVLSGLAPAGASRVCSLFGRTAPAPAAELRRRYASRADYLSSYRAATEAAIAAGVVLADDRDELLADARPDAIGW